MKITVIARPAFVITITREQITAIAACSKVHYDHTCRAQTLPGGFIYGWLSLLAFSPTEFDFEVTLERRQIDLACKILEMPPEKQKLVARSMSDAFHAAWHTAQRELGHLSIPVCLAPSQG